LFVYAILITDVIDSLLAALIFAEGYWLLLSILLSLRPLAYIRWLPLRFTAFPDVLLYYYIITFIALRHYSRLLILMAGFLSPLLLVSHYIFSPFYLHCLFLCSLPYEIDAAYCYFQIFLSLFRLLSLAIAAMMITLYIIIDICFHEIIFRYFHISLWYFISLFIYIIFCLHYILIITPLRHFAIYFMIISLSFSYAAHLLLYLFHYFAYYIIFSFFFISQADLHLAERRFSLITLLARLIIFLYLNVLFDITLLFILHYYFADIIIISLLYW